MAVRTSDFALRDLSFDPQPCETEIDHVGDIPEFVIPNVIELEDRDVGLAAIDARVGREIVVKARAVRSNSGGMIPPNTSHLSLVVGPMALGLVCGEARLAPCLEPI